MNIFVILFAIAPVSSCKLGTQRSPGSINDQEASAIVDRIETIKQVYHLCPSPAEMLGVIDVSDLSFESDLLNPVENADKYLDSRSMNLGLGIYITDMAYAALFGRHEETLEYLETVRSVAEQIRVTGAITDELMEKARNNLESLDSLFTISNEAFINMLFFCERNNRPNTVVMFSSGVLIESLYIAVKSVDDYNNAGYILQHLADQKYAIDNLMFFGESLKEMDPNIETVMNDLMPLKEIYDGILDGSGETEPELISPEVFEKLKEETIRIRTRLVNG